MKLLAINTSTDFSKIENRCKKNTGEFTLFWGVQVVSVYSYNEPTTGYCIYLFIRNIESTHYYASLKHQ